MDSGASMHMISKKDLNSAELETVTTSRSPTAVITANGEVQTNEEATVYVRELDIFLTMKVREGTPAVLSLGKLCDEHGYSYEWINGQKPHLIKNGIGIQCNTENFVPIVVLGLSASSSSSSSTSTSMTSSTEIDHSDHPPAMVSSESADRQVRRDPYSSETPEELLHEPTKIPKPNKNKNQEQVRGDPNYSDMPDLLQEFRENLVDERVPEHRLTREICQRTKITRAPRRRRIGRVVPRAENFGDLITADRKVLSEGCESRNNHRYAVVVQDVATQWIQSFPCTTKTSLETERCLQKFLEPKRKPKVIYTGNSLEFGKACEDLSWNHCKSTPHRSETNGIVERAVRRVKEGTSAVLLQSGLDESWWADFMECYTYLRNVTDLLSDGKTPYERRFGEL